MSGRAKPTATLFTDLRIRSMHQNIHKRAAVDALFCKILTSRPNNHAWF